MRFRVLCGSTRESKSVELPQAPGGEICPVCGKINDRRFPADQQCDFSIIPERTEAVAETGMPMAL